MPMKMPPHPGMSVRYDCLEPVGLSILQAARILEVPIWQLNNLLYGKSGMTPDMAIRLDKAFGGTPEGWMELQAAFDLAEARLKKPLITVRLYMGKGASRHS